jgi:Cu-Zn family superoxide dismutase
VIGIANPAYSTVNTTGNDASSGATSVPVGVCDLQPINYSGVTGRVWLTPFASGVQVDAIIYNLTGTHGFHIHQYGDLRLTDTGNSTGGHYNPFSVNHGIPPYEIRHLGDMGNLYYSINATTMGYSYNFSINGNAPVISLTGTNNVIGRAIVIHSSPDNCSQPTGGSGNRIAFCVIGIGNTTATSLIGNYPSVPTTQNDTLCVVLASPTPSSSPAGASASSTPGAGASASSSPGASASSSPGAGASASPSPEGNDSLGSVIVPYFVAVVSVIVVMIQAN